jgi:fumarylacetoacetase
MKILENLGYFKGEKMSSLTSKVFQGSFLNDFMSLDRPFWREVRTTIQQLFSKGSPLEQNQNHLNQIVVDASQVQNHLAVRIGDYTDFYSSRSHAFNVGSIIRGPANALNENWLQIPIGYHGRASSVVVSGVPLRRPRGQVKAKDATLPTFSDCKRLDF